MRACTLRISVQWKEVIFMTYAGLRGAVSLCVALFVDHLDGVPQLVKDIVIFRTCLCVFFTVFFNGMTAGWVYKCLRSGDKAACVARLTLARSSSGRRSTTNSPACRTTGFIEHNTTAAGFECAKLLQFKLVNSDTKQELAQSQTREADNRKWMWRFGG